MGAFILVLGRNRNLSTLNQEPDEVKKQQKNKHKQQRSMGNRRELEVGGRQLVIYDHDIDDSTATGTDLAGSSLWDCAITLAHYVPIYAQTNPLSSKTLLELGAGTGLPGLTAALFGARVTLTDLPHLLPGLHRNVEANSKTLTPADVRVMPLRWGDAGDVAALGVPFDFILMSDLLYDVSAMPALCWTLKALSDSRTQILLAYELRFGTTECFKAIRDAGFGWVKVPKEDLHPVWQSEDIGIFSISYV